MKSSCCNQRVIKFRGKEFDGERWIYGYLEVVNACSSNNDEYFIHSFSDWNLNSRFRVEPESVGQFTGLKDKNEKDIYEGDIIQHTRTNWYCPGHPQTDTDLIDNCEIYFDEDTGVISERTIDLTRKNQPPYSSSSILTLNSFLDSRADENIIEVIGNIYENPNLLK